MVEIITDPIACEKRVKTTSPEVTITNPEVGDNNIRFKSVSRIMLDGVTVASNPAPDVVRNLAGVMTEVQTEFDPILQKEVTCSAACVALMIQRWYCNWWAEDEKQRNPPPEPVVPVEPVEPVEPVAP